MPEQFRIYTTRDARIVESIAECDSWAEVLEVICTNHNKMLRILSYPNGLGSFPIRWEFDHAGWYGDPAELRSQLQRDFKLAYGVKV